MENKELNQKIVKPYISQRNWIEVMALLFLAITFVSLLVGSVSISPGQIFRMLFDWEHTKAMRIMLYVRLPRVMGAVFAGAGLAVAGAIIQSVLNNSLAGPNIIGVNAGAGFAVVLFGALFPLSYAALPFIAFLGALLTVLLVYFVARKTGASKLTLVLSGIAINSLLNAASDAVITFVPDALLNSYSFRLGGLSGINSNVLIPACICITIGVIAAFCLHNEMDILSLGEDTAKSLGLGVAKYRFLLLVVAAVLAGASVSFAGLLGFVGLIVPHMARLLVGAEGKYLIPMSTLMGAAFLTLCDLLSRKLFAPYDISVGIVLAFLGAPFFLYLLMQKKGRGTL